MKINFTLVLLFLCGLSMSAQQDFCVVTGNVGEKDVNIQVVDTEYGTSSNQNGDFKLLLPKSDRQLGLLFSCVGYYDTLVSIVPQQDTIHIRFKMQQQVYMLEAASVTAEKITYYYNKPNFVMFDFEILDDKFFILQKKMGLKKDFRILVTDLDYEPIDTIFLPKHIEPEHIILDCMNNCQIVGQDSVYQIVRADNDYIIAFSCERNYYRTLMDNILFVSDKYLYINDLRLDGYISKFYRINLKTKEKEDLFLSDDSKSYREVQREVEWHKNHMLVVNNISHSPSVEDWEIFIKNAWYHTMDSYLAKVADTLYFFDHLNSKIEAYDEEMNLLHSCNITYPEKRNHWRHTIYQDRVWGTFYTIFGTTLNEIDVKTGKTIPRADANNYLCKKMIICKGNLYSLKKRRDSGNSEVSLIEKTKLD